MQLIYLNDSTKANDKLNEILDKLNRIKNNVRDLDLIYEDFQNFFYISRKNKIEEIDKIKNEIVSGTINNYEKNYLKKCKKYIDEYKNKAEERKKKKESGFFRVIYTENKKVKGTNDVDWITNTEKQFNKLEKIFSENDLRLIFKEKSEDKNKNILKLCLNEIKNKSNEEIMKEIDKLIEIFKINIYEVDKERLVKKMKLLARCDDIKNEGKSILILFKYIKNKETEFQKNVKELVVERLEKYFDDANAIEEADNILKEVGIDNDELYKKANDEKHGNNYVIIMNILTDHPDSITFLIKRKKEEFEYLKELVGEDDSGILTVNHIIDLEKCFKFIEPLIIKTIDDKNLIKNFVENAKKSEGGLEANFKSYSDSFSEIKNLLETRLDKSEASRQKIKCILDDSEFKLKSIKDDYFDGHYTENSKKKKIDNIDELLELRDRALLTKKLTITKDTDEDIIKENNQIMENNKIFIDTVYEINNILSLLKIISISGYPNDIIIKLKINKNKPSYSYNEEIAYNTYKSINELLKRELNNITESQKKAYKENEFSRFIYGRQFNLIKSLNKEKIHPLLMYISRNLMNKQIDYEFNNFNKSNTVENIINGCQSYLEKIFKANKLDFNKIYGESIIYKDYNNYRGFYTNFIDKSENLERDLFLIYKYLTKKFPIAQNILLCTKDTSNEELTAFMYRAILCQHNALFIVGGIENLEYEKKAKILELLNHLLDYKKDKMESCLIILYTNNNSDLYKSLNSIKNRKDLEIKSSEYSKMKISKEESNIELIDSDNSGVGKSRHIEKIIKDSAKQYIYFPFGGVINRADIIKRLKNLNISNPEKCAIHLDLNDTEQTELMTEFLFSILITKIYGREED